jgi:multiple sugar transport system permease protein
MMKKFFGTASPFQLSPFWMLISYVFLLIWAFIVLFPFYWLFVTAFKLPIDVNSGPKYIPFVDYEPDTHAFEELLYRSGNLVTRPYMNTITVGLTSAILTLIIGSLAAYALIRFEYRPKPGLILTFVACIGLAVLLMSKGMEWRPAVVIAGLLYLLIAQTIGRRFPGGLNNDDIAFWIVSQRMLPPVAVILPIYMMFLQLDLLDTRAAPLLPIQRSTCRWRSGLCAITSPPSPSNWKRAPLSTAHHAIRSSGELCCRWRFPAWSLHS